MLLPSVIIHAVVGAAGRAVQGGEFAKGLGKGRAYLPVIMGLALIPSFPFVLDQPIEKVVEYIDKKFPYPA